MNAGQHSAAGRRTISDDRRIRPNLLGRALHALVVAVAALACLAGSAPAVADTFDENNLLLLDVTLERQRLASSVTAYAFGDSALVSLAEVGAALDFPIVVEAQTGNARGWFIAPARSFVLDFNGGFVEIEGKRMPFSRNEAFLHDNGIFVTVDTFSRWFPVTLRLQRATLSLNIEPRERLPVQEREARRRGAQQSGAVGPATLPPVKNPYRLLGPPAADIALGYSIRRKQDSSQSTTGLNYSALLANDVAYMDSKIYLGGSQNQALSNARATLSRDRLALPLGLRYVELGDIVPVTPAGVNYSGVERGFLVQGGGSATGRDDLINSNAITLNGDALEGWDVELFQNGMRIAFQTVGPDGRYDFRDIEPLSGENEFELVFYGPAGERRSERVTRFSGLGPDQPGSVRYQFSASEKGKPLYAAEGDPARLLNDRGTARLAAGVDVRILPGLSLSSAWNSLVVDGARLNYTMLGARTRWRDLTLDVNATRDPLQGTRWDAALQLPASMRVRGFDARLSHTHYTASVLEAGRYDLTQHSRTGLTLNGPIGAVATRFSFFHNRDPERTSNALSAGFTSRYGPFYFGNTFNYLQFGRFRDTGLQEPSSLSGNLFFSTGIYPLSLRGGADYSLSPKFGVHQYLVDSNLRIASDMTMQFGVTHAPDTGITLYSSGFNWQLPAAILSPRITYDSNGEFSGFVYATFSLAPRPDRKGLMMSSQSLASSGSVAARVFLDNDRSGNFSAGDEPLSNVTIRAPQAYRSGKTDEQGVAYLTSMPTTRVTDVALAQETLPSTTMTSLHAGNSVRPRPAAPVTIDFPVVATGEIDGRVYIIRQGLRAPLPGVMVELRNDKGEVADFKISAYDGYFLFTAVPYNKYTLELAGDRRKTAKPRSVVVGREQPVQSNMDIVALEPEPAATPPTPEPMPATPTPEHPAATTSEAEPVPAPVAAATQPASATVQAPATPSATLPAPVAPLAPPEPAAPAALPAPVALQDLATPAASADSVAAPSMESAAPAALREQIAAICGGGKRPADPRLGALCFYGEGAPAIAAAPMPAAVPPAPGMIAAPGGPLREQIAAICGGGKRPADPRLGALCFYSGVAP